MRIVLTKEQVYTYHLFEEILNRSGEGVNVVDTKGVLVYVNQVSAAYCNSSIEEMIGRPITDFYPDAMLLHVLRNKNERLNEKMHYIGKKRYMCSSYPIYRNGEFLGAYSVFRDVQEIDDLNKKVKYLELQVRLNQPEEDISAIVDEGGALSAVFAKAKKTVGSLGGPRHCIITGESGTGKTMLANLIYNYAKRIGVIAENAPFIEINCAQFSNPDIAAMEIFGSVEGAYTGSKRKKGLFEQADGGILFLDEAHALENYQNMLLKAIESGKIRRIGDTKEISINVIIIAASTRDLHEVLLPELYQRLAQYAMHLPSLQERGRREKERLLKRFVEKYQQAVWDSLKIRYTVHFTPEAREALLNAVYPRNIRQFRDVINFSIDASSPLIEDVKDQQEISTVVGMEHLPFELMETEPKAVAVLANAVKKKNKIDEKAHDRIMQLSAEGLGPRKIAARLREEGYDLAYYQVAYDLKKKQP
ncbi:MAG TPA: sigma 54-interacting transcriptional regulator [Firmicutes bacterium]|nr:sigma 54-interacting transcriptional regulator [Bacillota bacterium]